MTIKKRTPEEDARAAAIDAFAGGATPAAAEPPAVEPPKAATRRAPAASHADSEGVALTMLLRFPDADLPTRLQRLADADERSKHYIALRALEAGLEVLES